MFLQRIIFWAWVALLIPMPTVVARAAAPNIGGDADIVSIDDIMEWESADTPCASDVLTRAVVAHADEITPDVSEPDVRAWVYRIFSAADVLRDVLKCPEIARTPEYDTISFTPIVYTFPENVRTITIRYAAQPHLLKQRLALGENRRTLPSDDANPAIGDNNDGTIWTNTDPAWYGIMVVESGALDEFVGPDKNNTISLQYINDNIDRLYPRGMTCTSKSAFANNNYAINRAVTATVGLAARGEKDTNDYYVAGDVNLKWISYAEIGLDVVLTVATLGGGAVVAGATKAARASKTLKNLSTSLREIMKLDTVRDYMRVTTQYARAAEELKTIDRATDAAGYAAKTREIERLRDSMRTMEEIDDIKRYREMSATYSEINAYRHSLRGLRSLKAAQRGNVIARAWRAFRAANSGGKTLSRGAKLARSSMKSGKIRDWLFQQTMMHAGQLARIEQGGGLLYGIWKFGLDMYDYTDTSTDEYTNGIDFKPLLLLSADDLSGQENVVNYGMWLMWAGDSQSAADDDAAFLQAMDFAAKFHQDLTEIQNDTAFPCNVDIYIVRPIIRNPGATDSALYYLVMNDVPWTTASK